MRPRVSAVIAVAVIVTGVVTWAALSAGEDEKAAVGSVGERVSQQLRYLDPRSSAVVAVDMRYGEENWDHVRTVASRLLRELRGAANGDVSELPPNLSGALQALVANAGLSFEEDVEPLLDGYLSVGVTLPARHPLPGKLQRLDDLLGDGAFYSPVEGGYVRLGERGEPDSDSPPPAEPVLVREGDGSRVTRAEGTRYEAAVRRREDATEPRFVVTYRSPDGDFEKVIRKVLEGDPPKKIEGQDDAQLLEESIALVEGDTLVLAFGGEGTRRPGETATPALLAALRRAEEGRGYPAARLASAQRRGGSEDPLVVATGDLTLARAAVEEPNLRRARREVPYLAAVRDVGAVVDLDSERATGRLRVGTAADRLKPSDLPVPDAGSLELPDTALVAGGSRDQSVTTTFAAGVARALFADSRFIRAVERAERDLDMRFEDEVLRQFNCPSVSVFDTRSRRFGARSCLRDPERMRRLLPRLAPHLPRIVRGLQGLGDEGLLALLMVAPDAPAVPSLPLGAIRVKPPPRSAAGQRETIYEVTGLRDDVGSAVARSGPERMVFGMIGERFVVASDRNLARRAARMPSRRHEGRAASATRIAGRQLVAAAEGDDEGPAVARILRDLVLEVSADRSALVGVGRLEFGD